MTYLLSKIRTAALAYAGFAPYFGAQTQNAFRWYDQRESQGTKFPAMLQTLISNPREATFLGDMNTTFARVQFEVWSYDPVLNDTIFGVLRQFLAQFNAYGLSGLAANANYVIGDRTNIYAETQPSQYQRIIDTKIFNNELV